MRKTILYILLIALWPAGLKAQINQGGIPYSISYSLAPLVEFEQMPAFQRLKLLSEDAEKRAKGLKDLRFAKMFDVAFHPYNSGTWEETGEGRVWRLGIQSKNASSLYLVFKEYQLVQGVKLFIYNESQTGLAGAFTSKNNNKINRLTIAPIEGEKLIIELNIPFGTENFGRLMLGRVGHDYKNAFGKSKLKSVAESSEPCNVDIVCPAGEPWKDEKRAVCKIVANGELCTGTLVNNTDEAKLAYLLTAQHCMEDQTVAEEATYIFNYEKISCGGKEYTSPMSLSGSELLATTNYLLDFSLVNLLEYPPLYYRPFFAGWDAREVEPSSATCLHHPNGDATKITIDYHPLSTGNYGEDYDPYSHWMVSSWELGSTQGGSSGAPIFNSQHRVVGTLTGGPASCESPSGDFFTKFSLAWNKYPNPENQLKYWLDPNNKGVMFMTGMKPYKEVEECDTFWNVPDDEFITTIKSGLSWGSISGHNSKRFVQFAEKFHSNTLLQTPGVFLYVAENSYANPLSYITLKIWDGSFAPTTEIYSRNVYLRSLRDNEINFIGFDTLVSLAGTFFIGYEVNYQNKPDTFSVYHASDRGTQGPSTMFVNDGSWKNIDAAASVYTSLSVGLLTCGGNMVRPKAKKIAVFPNPSSSVAQVDIPEGITITGVECFDLTGRRMPLSYRRGDNTLVIYPGDLANGIYVLKLITYSKPLITKFQVVK